MAKSRAKKRTQQLSRQPPEEILAAHKLNYAIPLADIRNARMDDPEVVAKGVFEVETATGTQGFSLTDEEAYSRHAGLLKGALGDRLVFD